MPCQSLIRTTTSYPTRNCTGASGYSRLVGPRGVRKEPSVVDVAEVSVRLQVEDGPLHLEVKRFRLLHPNGSMYCLSNDSGSKHHTRHGFWNQHPQIGSIWTLWAL